jgi:hypothetical protein
MNDVEKNGETHAVSGVDQRLEVLGFAWAGGRGMQRRSKWPAGTHAAASGLTVS